MKKQLFLTLSLLFFIGNTYTGNHEAPMTDSNTNLDNTNKNKQNPQHKNRNVYFVILAGGNGTRLWPLSRANKPKQFLCVGSNKTLIDQAIDRVCDIAPKENIWISTTEQHVANIEQYVGNRIGHIVIEPGLRNTAPAILLACLEIQKVNPNASIIFLPSDPFISDKTKFATYVHQAIDFIEHNDKITLFGIKPTYPATGYGYIEFNNKDCACAPYPVIRFREKPALEVAQKYIKQDSMVWNIGMFCAHVNVFLQEFATHAPEIFKGVSAYVHGDGDYNTVKSDSIDYAIMEKSNNICVIPADFPWCDVGNIEVFLAIEQQHKQLENNVVCVNSHNNLVQVADKLVALVYVDDICIVESDGILLVTKRDKAEYVKEVVEQLKNSKNSNHL